MVDVSMEDYVLKKLSFTSLLLVLFFPYPSTTLPLCTNLRAPFTLKKPLGFCPYNGTVCCDSSKDLQLQKRFLAMNVSDTACASAVKSILCATCDQFSAELFKVKSEPQPIPILCNSTNGGGGGGSSSSKDQTNNNFCSNVWNVCQNISIIDSPFAPALQNKAGTSQNSTSSKLTDLWQSKTEFCNAFGDDVPDEEDSVCFRGHQVKLNQTTTTDLDRPTGICLEKIGKGSYLNMVAHPDGSNRAFFSDQPGKIWLATIPDQDSGEGLGLDESTPFVDLTDQIYLESRFGMMGMAFHPNFAKNGRFFASYNCAKEKNPGCSGRCACNTDVGCDPSKIVSPDEGQPCQYYTVVAEFTANGTASNPSMANKGKPLEVRRIFTMGLPFAASHGGQILFNPEDGYFYFMMGDGGSKDDPFNFAQNKKSLLGKIMRLDVDNIPSEEEIDDLDLWGNYSIPRDNPYAEDREMEPEIWAMGLRNPWRCSFDSERPSYFFCADIGQDKYEEVNMITKGGNYGWSSYEGPIPFKTQESKAANSSSLDSVNLIFPITGYNHSDVNKKEGSAAICGGYVYRGTTDPCLYGSYLYGDLYAQYMWAAAENPRNSGNFTAAAMAFSCARDSPLPCSTVPNSRLPALSYIFSFGQDNKKDVFVLTQSGVYRVVRPSRCNYACSKENVTPTVVPAPAATPSCSYLPGPLLKLTIVLSFVILLIEIML